MVGSSYDAFRRKDLRPASRNPEPPPAIYQQSNIGLHRIGHPRNDPIGDGERAPLISRRASRISALPKTSSAPAQQAIAEDFNQYAITWGAKPFRDAIAAKYRKWYGLDYDPEREITVCCGSTEGMIASMLAITNPGDEVIVFEPYYENYGPDTFLCDAKRKLVSLRAPDWTFDPDELRRAFSSEDESHHSEFPEQPHRPRVHDGPN